MAYVFGSGRDFACYYIIADTTKKVVTLWLHGIRRETKASFFLIKVLDCHAA